MCIQSLYPSLVYRQLSVWVNKQISHEWVISSSCVCRMHLCECSQITWSIYSHQSHPTFSKQLSRPPCCLQKKKDSLPFSESPCPMTWWDFCKLNIILVLLLCLSVCSILHLISSSRMPGWISSICWRHSCRGWLTMLKDGRKTTPLSSRLLTFTGFWFLAARRLHFLRAKSLSSFSLHM